MNKKITLYHGSERIIQKPLYGEGRAHNDFGQGFYCTEELEAAREWACTMEKNGFANEYELDISDLSILDLNTPDYTILNWITVLLEHRIFRLDNPIAGKTMKYLKENFSVNVNAYDVVIGYRADDAYYDFANAFLNNAITVEQLSAAMRLGKLGEQFALKSPYAFEKLRFKQFHTAEREIYYPKKKAGNEKAIEEYRKMEEETVDGLYMIDILRKKVKNDDPCLPRNLSL